MSEEKIIEQAKKFAELDKQLRELEGKTKIVKVQMNEIEESLLDGMRKEGIPKLQVALPDGSSMSVGVKRQMWIHCADMEKGVLLLKQAGLPQFVSEKYNAQTVSAWMRNDLPRDKDDLPIFPEELKDVFSCSEVFSISTRLS